MAFRIAGLQFHDQAYSRKDKRGSWCSITTPRCRTRKGRQSRNYNAWSKDVPPRTTTRGSRNDREYHCRCAELTCISNGQLGFKKATQEDHFGWRNSLMGPFPNKQIGYSTRPRSIPADTATMAWLANSRTLGSRWDNMKTSGVLPLAKCLYMDCTVYPRMCYLPTKQKHYTSFTTSLVQNYYDPGC